MAGDAAVGVDQDLPAGKSGVAGGTADDEPPAGVHEDFGVRIKQVARDDLFDYVLGNVFLDLSLVTSGPCWALMTTASTLAATPWRYSTVTWDFPSGRR